MSDTKNLREMADALFEQLDSATALSLGDLSADGGLFLLRDHEGNCRFVGFANHEEGFRGRIYERHATGDEGHRYSGYYNVGRMWRIPKIKTDNPDAKLAKKLRNAFCREYLTVKVLPLALDEQTLQEIAREISRQHPGKTDWNRQTPSRIAEREPEPLVNELLDKLNWSENDREAVNRQAKLYQAYRSTTS